MGRRAAGRKPRPMRPPDFPIRASRSPPSGRRPPD